jgi:hypothetical protein
MTCSQCPPETYQPICEHFGFCKVVDHLVVASSDCEREEAD